MLKILTLIAILSPIYNSDNLSKKVFVARLKSGNVLVEYEENGKVIYKVEKNFQE